MVELFNKTAPIEQPKRTGMISPLRFVRWVQQLEPMLALDGLLWVLEHHSEYQIQMVVGELLQRASVGCPIPLDDLLSRLLPGIRRIRAQHSDLSSWGFWQGHCTFFIGEA